MHKGGYSHNQEPYPADPKPDSGAARHPLLNGKVSDRPQHRSFLFHRSVAAVSTIGKSETKRPGCDGVRKWDSLERSNHIFWDMVTCHKCGVTSEFEEAFIKSHF